MEGNQVILATSQAPTSFSMKVVLAAGQLYDRAVSTYTGFNNTTPASFQPAISTATQLSLAIVFTVLFAVLFLLILVQLCLILYFGHRRLSYQSVFLFIYLIWAALRVTLFSFYFNDSVRVNLVSLFVRWLLFAVPIYLQFLTLSLLTLYLAKVVLRTRRTPLDPITYRKHLLISFATVNIIFLAVNISSAFICPKQDAHEMMVIVRVVINGFLFVLVGVVLCFCIIKITRPPAVNILLEGEGATPRQGMMFCILVVLLYLSRVIYNLVAVTVPHDVSSFGFGWISVSDEGEIKYESSKEGSIHVHEDIRNREFITFGVVLTVWEVLPTFMVVWFFRVRRPNVGDMGPPAIASQSYDKRSYFFNDARRYDSDEDLTNPQGAPRGNYKIPGVLSPSTSSVSVSGRTARSYGSISGTRSGSFQRSNSASNLASNIYIPGTTPPQLFTAGSGYQPSVLVEQRSEQ